MKEVSIQDFKAHLSARVAEAEAGTTLVITRHHEPVAQIGPARSTAMHRGEQVGTGRLEPAVTRGSGGRYLAILQEDRGDR